MRSLLPVLLAALVAGCTSAVPGTPTTAAEPDVQARWWTWAASSTEERNPVLDATGAHCAEDQPADLWFVAGTFGGAVERTCEVPAGRALVGPVVNFTSATAAGCEGALANGSGEVTFDGEPLGTRRLGPARVTIRGVAGNVVTGSASARQTYACGLWVTVPPPSPGEHELVIDGRGEGFRTTVRYRLVVAAASD
ncbi:hypothetical protein FHX81_6187 [Saccharothrix saharensis]|uniref:Ig-like domain-containing protein n=1 Tax=Saccharothrix saharensis TaxID=571190 RepID=A0A543JLP3_9PSEU|nr:signal protein [Saccharothrix saharensis]TQM83760.1 hypothetical protein FHX81_6187 [Saccharothrix saharensis]